MRIQYILYPEELSSIVKQVVVIQETDSYPRLNTIPYVADGLPGIYFQKSEYEVLLNKQERRLSKLFLYGQTVNPITIDTVGAYTVIIIQLYPPAIKSLFGIDAHELTDTCIDYEYIIRQDGHDLMNRLLEEDNIEAQIGMLKDALMRLLYEVQPETRNGIYHATQSIMDSGGLISLSSIYKELKISERTFQRLFLQHVGVSPSQFKGIIRFHMAFSSLQSTSDSLSQIAYKHGFSDQSHFIRIFKTFTGKTPGEYIAEFRNSLGNEDVNI